MGKGWAQRYHLGPSYVVTAELAFPLPFKELGAFKDLYNRPRIRWGCVFPRC